MEKFIVFSQEDGAWMLQRPGYILLALLILAAILLNIFVAQSRQNKTTGKKVSPKQLAVCGILLALAFVLSYLPFLKIHMPYGGSVTLFTMLMICYAGYLYGARVGLLTAFAYSLLQFWSGASYMLSPFQVCCDYLFAFTALGIAGVFMGKKHGLVKGYILGCILRGLFHTIGGYLYWMDYMPEEFPAALAKLYPVIYNYSYILAEMVLTLIVIQIPPVKKMLRKLEELA